MNGQAGQVLRQASEGTPSKAPLVPFQPMSYLCRSRFDEKTDKRLGGSIAKAG